MADMSERQRLAWEAWERENPEPRARPAATPNRQAPADPPGWYPDPSAPTARRYWDGSAWTDKVAAGNPDSTLETVGWIGAFLFPLLGLVVGVILAARNNKNAVWILLISIGSITFWWLFLMSTANSTTTGY